MTTQFPNTATTPAGDGPHTCEVCDALLTPNVDGYAEINGKYYCLDHLGVIAECIARDDFDSLRQFGGLV